MNDNIPGNIDSELGATQVRRLADSRISDARNWIEFHTAEMRRVNQAFDDKNKGNWMTMSILFLSLFLSFRPQYQAEF